MFVAMTVMAGFIVAQLGNVSGQSNALAISPRKDYNLSPGQSIDDTLTVTNRNSEEPLNLNLSVIDFDSQDETGTPKLMRDATERTAWSLKNFIDLPQQVVVAPGETTRIPIRIDIPADTGAGSYYSAIEYSAGGANGESQVNISASGVSLVFVTVPGQAKQQLSLLQFGAFVQDQSGNTGSFKGLYFSDRPKVLAYRLKNDGNIAENPNATIIVKDFSGKVVYEIEDANQKDQLALRGQTRRFDSCINPEDVVHNTSAGTDINSIVCGDTNFAPGRYTAELSVTYGSNGNETRTLTEKTTFWYLPWWFIGLMVVGLAVLIGAGFYVWRRIESYKGRKTRRR